MNNTYDITPQEQLEQILVKLVECVSLSTEEVHAFTQKICDIYAEKDFRHSYSKISLVLEEFRPDQRDALSAHILDIYTKAEEYVKVRYASDEKLQKSIIGKISKLCDHVDLECLRIARIDRVEYIGRTASNELTAADGKLQETEERAEELKSRVSSYQEQSIAILGIFAGLVVAFSGVIQFESSGLENLSNVSTLNITYFVCLSLFFLFNIVFLLMYCISKIAGSSIATECRKRQCAYCKACKGTLNKLIKKYPYIFWFDLFAIILCVVLCCVATVERIVIYIPGS